MLRALFAGFGVERREAEALADAVVAYRVDPQGAPRGGVFARKPASFHTALELDQVPGVEAQLFRMSTLFVTVHSHQPGLYAQAAPPALFAALAGFDAGDVAALTRAAFSIDINRDDPHFPSEFKRGAASGAFLVHAEAVLPSGQTGVSEAIFDMRANGAAGDALRETRRGTARSLGDLRLLMRQGSIEFRIVCKNRCRFRIYTRKKRRSAASSLVKFLEVSSQGETSGRAFATASLPEAVWLVEQTGCP